MKKRPPKDTSKYVLGVRVDAELKARIQDAAAADQRSISQWMAMAARALLKEKSHE